MPQFTQANRPIRVDTVLGEDVLLLSGFSGTETVSVPFSFQLDLLSEDEEIAPEDVLRTPMVVGVVQADGTERKIHGLVRSFGQLGQHEMLTSYRAEIVPWLWFLSLSQDCRIFQEMDVLEIVQEVFDSLGYSDYDLRCSGSYPKREYCVQYRESHLDFVSRLLEEEGIFYFFEHTDDKHVLVLADSNTAAEPCPGPAKVRIRSMAGPDEDHVATLEREHSVHVGTVSLTDYDYLQPPLSLDTSLSGDGVEEVYDYRARWYTDQDQGERRARLLLEEKEARRHVVFGRGSCRHFRSGFTFELDGHYRKDMNREYVLLKVSHSVRVGSFRSWDDAVLDHDVGFVAIPVEVPFRPPPRTPKPVMRGAQTAEVVGKAGEEIWTDENGRIKVQFHWDRLGEKNEDSSCWIRVASRWAGKSWGEIHLPRIGQEVLVEFLDGDPDNPIVTGAVYNADQPPPFDLPSNQTKSGMKSRSSKGGGGYNEISIDDRKGEEKVTVHAQKDMSTTVLNNDSQTVHNDRTITVNGTHTETIKKDTVIRISEGTLVHQVVQGTADYTVEDDLTETYNSNQTTVVDGELFIQAGDKITLLTGESSLVMQSDGTIILKGKNVVVEGTADVKVEAPKIGVSGGQETKMGVSNQQITCDNAKVSVSGAAVNSTAIGMHEIVGAVVKIN